MVLYTDRSLISANLEYIIIRMIKHKLWKYIPLVCVRAAHEVVRLEGFEDNYGIFVDRSAHSYEVVLC